MDQTTVRFKCCCISFSRLVFVVEQYKLKEPERSKCTNSIVLERAEKISMIADRGKDKDLGGQIKEILHSDYFVGRERHVQEFGVA